ncbi:MAG: hypothetical protein M0008_11795 [Actinomycetota bacterium]|jgi:hypothetical protein|nr:hypothetical protein [Actinomycetota bacterium]
MKLLWLDPYERRARLAPGLLALLPIAVAVVTLGLREVPPISIILQAVAKWPKTAVCEGKTPGGVPLQMHFATACLGLLSVPGGPLALARQVRRLGLAAQDALWERWGSSPATIALRLRETAANATQRDIWRDAVEAETNVRLLSARQEASQPAKADDVIEAAVAQLRERTRSDNMVKAENMNYGFQRNLYGIRIVGRWVAALCSGVLVGVLVWQVVAGGGSHVFHIEALIAGLILCAILFTIWFWLPSEDQVRQAGEKYAYQLQNAAVTLQATGPAAVPAAGDGSSSGRSGRND